MDKNKKHTLFITLWCIFAILAVLITPLLMWCVYVIKANGDPNISVTVGYWVGFITIFVPVGTIIYGYISKLHNQDDKRYWILYLIGAIAFILILILILAGISITVPMS